MDTIGDKKRKIRSEDKEIVITITEVVTRTIGLLPGTCHSQMGRYRIDIFNIWNQLILHREQKYDTGK